MKSFKQFYIERINYILENLDRLDELTLQDFKGNDGISSLTKKFQKQRSQKYGSESKVAKINDVKLDGKGRLVVKFKTPSTDKKSKKYTMTVKFDDFEEFYNDLKDEMTKENLKYVFKNMDMRLRCTCPAFKWQGMKYNLSQMDTSVGKETHKDDYWGPKHNNDNLLCKHLQGLINNIDFFKNPIVSKVNKMMQ